MNLTITLTKDELMDIIIKFTKEKLKIPREITLELKQNDMYQNEVHIELTTSILPRKTIEEMI